MTDGDAAIDEAVDNDVLLKALRLGCTAIFWPTLSSIGVLGAARFVIRDRIQRGKFVESDASIADRAAALFDIVCELEPTSDELDLANELEREAQHMALPLDAGESQLCAIVVLRGLALFTTGDKRAIESLEKMRRAAPWLDKLAGRIRCLEQLVATAVADDAMFAELGPRVCKDVSADKTLSICFGCLGGSSPSASDVGSCLESYINAVRESAPTLLAAQG
jgi:hypothetical protein